MKKIIFSIFAFITIVNIGCKKSNTDITPTAKDGTVNVFFNNLGNGNAISLGAEPNITNALGQKFSVNILKYYISQIRLTDDKGVVTNLGNFTLINEDVDVPKRNVPFLNLPNGNYKTITFNFGLDKITNALPLAQGDLDHSLGMWWNAEKYLFLKHEGNFIDSGINKSLLYHYGTDGAYVPDITLPIIGLTVAGNTKTVVLDFNLEKIYNSIDFKVQNNMMSDAVNDKAIVGVMANNIKTAFVFNKIK